MVSQSDRDRASRHFREHREEVLARMREKDREKTTAIHAGIEAGKDDPESLFAGAGAIRRKRPYTRP